MLHWTAATFADFLMKVREDNKAAQVKTASEAVSTTYELAFDVKVTGGTMAQGMRRKAKKDTERVRLPAEQSIDPKVITDYWRSRPANEHLDNQELRIKTIVLTKLFWGARAKDLECLPHQSTIRYPANLFGRELHRTEWMQVSYYNSKTGEYDKALANNKWSKEFKVMPLQAKHIKKLHALKTEQAQEYVERVCPVRAFGELEHRLEELIQLKRKSQGVALFPYIVNLGHRRCGAASCFSQAGKTLLPDSPLKWLKSSTISSLTRDWYNMNISPVTHLRCGDNGDFVPSEFRHFCARSFEMLDCKQERVDRLTQENAEVMWALHYGKVQENPTFRVRWDAVARQIKQTLNADTRMCC